MSAATNSASTQPSPLPAPPRRRRWLSIVLTLVVFISGFVLGAGTVAISIRNQALFALHHPEQEPARIAARLRRSLRLSDEQTQRVQQILEDRQAALESIRRDVQPRVVAELDLVEQQIAAVLDERQREQWEKSFRQLRETWIPPLKPRASSRSEKKPG
jgi:NADH dehydrogenase/NADH:ubiquinone oxidoreductase subunit G